jgi:hypothetical protein
MADALWYGGWVLAAMWMLGSMARTTPSLRELAERARAR